MKRSAIEILIIAVLGPSILGLYFFEVFKHKQPEIFDSMLCSVHTPVAAILVNDELIMCSQKIYRRVK